MSARASGGGKVPDTGSTSVEEIRVRNGRVREVATADGRSMVVDAVASNADVVHTYAKLLAGTDRGRAMARRLAGSRFSNSLFVVYFGLKRQYPEIAHHTVLFGRRYRELLSDIFEHGVLAGFYALAPVPHLGKAPLDWAVMGPKYRDKFLDALEKHPLPGLRANLVSSRIFTPADFSSELNARLGSAFSLEPLLTQSAFFRVHNRDDRRHNLYFVGAGRHSSAGIPGVLGSAQATAELLLADLGASRKG